MHWVSSKNISKIDDGFNFCVQIRRDRAKIGGGDEKVGAFRLGHNFLRKHHRKLGFGILL